MIMVSPAHQVSDPPGRLDPVDPGHFPVDHGDVEHPVLAEAYLYLLHSPVAGIRPHGSGPDVLQDHRRLPAHRRIVVHHQHLKAFQEILPFPLPLPLLVVGYQLEGMVTVKVLPLSFSLSADGSAHELHQIVDDGQAQTAAHIVAGIPRVLLLKGLEDPLHEFFRHADAIVPDHKLQVERSRLRAFLTDVHPQLSSRWREFQGVGEQVHQNLLHARGVADIMAFKGLPVAHLIARFLLQSLRDR